MTSRIFPLLFSLLMICSCANSQGQPVSPESFLRDSLPAYISQGLKDWNLPGMAVVVVKDGKVVLMNGYGVRSEGGQPVDSNTLFMIASNSKLFTATSLALLQSQGKLNLDDHITRFFPDYKLYDNLTTESVSVRDMLCHRLGTKTFQGDFTFWNTALDSKEIMRRMRFLKPGGIFRQTFGYCNSCFLTAGQVIPAVTGKSWEEFVRTNITDPLQMTHTRLNSNGMSEQPNVAVPYTTAFTGTLKQVPYDNWNNMAPAAAIISNVSDLSHWLMLQLDSGRYQGRQVLPWPVLQETRELNTIIKSVKAENFPTHFVGYGLGLFESDYNGRQVFWHTGGAGGMVSNVCFVPEERLGIAILTNNDNQEFYEALRHQLLDAFLGVPYINRSKQALTGEVERMKQQLEEIAGWKSRLKNNKPPLPLSAFAGRYSNPLYGPVSVEVQGSHLLIRFAAKPDLTATMEYLDGKDWLLTYNNILYGIFKSGFGIENGKVKTLTTQQNIFVEYDPYVFTKN